MQIKMLGRVLDIVGIISIMGFLAVILYSQLLGAGFSLRVFALAWSFIYLFTVTLGFRGSIDAHKDALRRFTLEWAIACVVGMTLAAFVIIVG